MGKSNQKKKNALRARKKVKETIHHEHSEPVLPQILESVIQQLQSESSEDRECGLITVGSFSSANAKGALKSLQFLEILGGLFNESNSAVKRASLRAANNLCGISVEFPEATVQLIVMPLCDVLSTYNTHWVPDKPPCADEENLWNSIIDTKAAIFIEAVNLVLNLVQIIPESTPVFNAKGVINLLLNHLDYQKFGPMVVFHSMQCLSIITDENSEACLQIREKTEAIFSFLQCFHHLNDQLIYLNISSLAFVTLLNSVCYDVTLIESHRLDELINTLQKILSIDLRTMIHEFSSKCPIYGQALEPGEDKSPREEHSLFEIHQVINATGSAIEIINNLSIDLSSDAEDEDMEKSEDDDDVNEGEVGIKREPRIFAPPLAEAFTKYGFAQRVLEKTTPLAENVKEILKSQGHGDLEMLVKEIQAEAFNCFNTLVEELPIEDVGGEEGLFKIWLDLGKKCFSDEGNLSSDANFIASACKVIRGVTQKFWEARNEKFFQEVTVEDVQKMIEVAKRSTNMEPRLNIVSTVGMLGSLLRQTKPDLMNLIVEFLIETSTKETSIRVIVEALDSLMDLLAEDDTDDYVAAIGLIPRLKQIMPGFKVKIAQHISSQSHKGHRSIGFIHDVRKNLIRFIKYKEKSPIIRVALLQEKNAVDK